MTIETAIDAGEIIEGSRLGSFHFLVIINTCLVMFIEGYDMQVVSYAAPSILKAWHLASVYFGPVFGFGLFGNLLGGTVLSHLGDRLGRKKVLLGGTVFFGIFTLAAAWATSVPALIILRLLAGVGIGASIPAAIALSVEYAPKRFKARVISVLFLGYTMGGTIGGFVAVWLIPHYGWPSVFVVGGLLPILIAAVSAMTLPESLRYLALRQKSTAKTLPLLRRLAPGLEVNEHTAIVVKEEKISGMPVRQLFAHGRAAATVFLWLAFVSSLLGHYFLTSWLPTILSRGSAPLGSAIIAGALLQGGGGIGGLVLGWLSDKRNMLYIAGAYCVACPFIMLLPHGHGATLLLLAFLVGFFLVGGQIGLNSIAGTIYPTNARATGVGWALGIGRIGSIAGPVLGGFLLSSHVPLNQIFIYAGLVAPVCALAIFMVFRRSTEGLSAESTPNPQRVV